MEKILLSLIITQIIIESLPISSSGHVTLVIMLSKKFLQKQEFCFWELIDPLTHTAALASILVAFYNDWMPLVKGLFCTIKTMFLFRPISYSKQKLLFIFFKIIGLILVADVVTAFFYLPLKMLFKGDTFFQNPVSLAFGFCCTALILFSIKVKQNHPSQTKPLNLKTALCLGVVQGLALLPGISRFASTYAAGYWLNLGKKRSFQISFLLQLPLIVAALLFQGILPLLKTPELLSVVVKPIFIITALTSTFIAIILLVQSYKIALKDKLWLWSLYMLVPIAILIITLK